MKRESLLEKQERIKKTYQEKAKKIKNEIKAAEKNEERKIRRDFLKLVGDVLTIEEDSLNIFLKDNYSLLVGFLTAKLDEDTKSKYIKIGEKILLKIENEKQKKKEKLKKKEEDIDEQPN